MLTLITPEEAAVRLITTDCWITGGKPAEPLLKKLPSASTILTDFRTGEEFNGIIMWLKKEKKKNDVAKDDLSDRC